MTDSFAIHLPPGFLAEVVAASILGGHLGAHNKGHDLVDANSQRVEVKSCSLKPAKNPKFLEIATGESSPGDCESLVFVSTSGSTAEATAQARMSEGVLSVDLSVKALRRGDQIRAYRLDVKDFRRLEGYRRSEKGERVTWRVPIAACVELSLK